MMESCSIEARTMNQKSLLYFFSIEAPAFTTMGSCHKADTSWNRPAKVTTPQHVMESQGLWTTPVSRFLSQGL
jgi:hypothetical protein